MTELQCTRLLTRMADGVPEMDAYHYAGLRLDSTRSYNAAVNRRLDHDARFRHRYLSANYRGAQIRADREHPFRY